MAADDTTPPSPAPGSEPAEPTSTPAADDSVDGAPAPDLDAPLFDTPELDFSLRESDDRIERRGE